MTHNHAFSSCYGRLRGFWSHKFYGYLNVLLISLLIKKYTRREINKEIKTYWMLIWFYLFLRKILKKKNSFHK